MTIPVYALLALTSVAVAMALGITLYTIRKTADQWCDE